MLVSLFTDASVCGQTGAAGWGAWARSDRGRAFSGGRMLEPTPDVGEAELQAVVFGLCMASERSLLLPGDYVLVQSDSMEAVNLLTMRKLPRSDGKRIVRDALFERARELEIRLGAKHVKGHSRVRQPRFWVNSLCDDLARRGMEAARAAADFPELPDGYEEWWRGGPDGG